MKIILAYNSALSIVFFISVCWFVGYIQSFKYDSTNVAEKSISTLVCDNTQYYFETPVWDIQDRENINLYLDKNLTDVIKVGKIDRTRSSDSAFYRETNDHGSYSSVEFTYHNINGTTTVTYYFKNTYVFLNYQYS